MSKPMPVMILGYAPSGTMPLPFGSRRRRSGLIYKGSSRLSGAASLLTTRTSLRFTSGAFTSTIPLLIRFRTGATLRLSQEPNSSLVTGYGETPSNTWSEYEEVLDLYKEGRPLFARSGAAVTLQYEIVCLKRVAV